MHQGSPSGVPADGTCDSAGALSQADVHGDRSFFTKERRIPAALGHLGTPVSAYYGGEETFEVRFGSGFAANFSVWTDTRGIDAMIDTLLALKVRAAHAWDQAKIVPSLEALHASDVPF